jgi:hypothetical protein
VEFVDNEVVSVHHILFAIPAMPAMKSLLRPSRKVFGGVRSASRKTDTARGGVIQRGYLVRRRVLRRSGAGADPDR